MAFNLKGEQKEKRTVRPVGPCGLGRKVKLQQLLFFSKKIPVISKPFNN
jgi:hypothetical protein